MKISRGGGEKIARMVVAPLKTRGLDRMYFEISKRRLSYYIQGENRPKKC